MKDELVRFGVGMEPALLEQLDRLAETRGCNRSEVLRDLTRAEVSRSALDERVPAFAAVTLVYNHHVRELSARLTDIQHGLGESVRSTLHVHLDHDHCLEVIVMRGRADHIREVANQLIGTRGVLQGGAEVVAESTFAHGHAHPHAHAQGEHPPHGHASHDHAHAHAPAPLHVKKRSPARATKRAAKPR
ncbi:MAG TPA: nickel-responsive transcriptional regulator NikR [Polyangiaceae bacterium]|nr:nickel-responsive transcriptional regulator NikR [Polyangiaceae bacterium]